MPSRYKRLKMTFDSRLDAIPPVALSIDSFCRLLGLDEQIAYSIQLAAVELMNNVVMHAYAGQHGHDSTISLRLLKTRLTIEVRHRGRPMPSGLLRRNCDPPSRNLQDLRESGWGLHLINAIMDSTTYHSQNGVHSFIMQKVIRPIESRLK